MKQNQFLSFSKVACIINPIAANKRWKRNIMMRSYIQKNLPGKFVDTHKDKEFTVRTATELCADYDVIVAAGGDGTIADVIQGIIKSDRADRVALGILPLGSGNAFRISLGIPLYLPWALKVLNEGHTRQIDLIDIGGRLGTFGSVGATAQVLVEKERHGIPGFFGHVLAARIMYRLSLREQQIDLFDGIDDDGNSFDHKVMNLKVFDVYIGKSRHFGYGWKIAPKARIDDGYIDLTFFETSSRQFLLYFPSIYFGTFQKTQKHFKAKRAVLKGHSLPVQYNGELLGTRDKVRLRILPQALKIIAPRPSGP